MRSVQLPLWHMRPWTGFIKKKITILFKSHVKEVGHTWHTDIAGNLQMMSYYTDELSCIWSVSLLMRQLRLRSLKNREQNSPMQQAAGCKSSLPTLEAFPGLCSCICCLSLSLCAAYWLSVSVLSSSGHWVTPPSYVGLIYCSVLRSYALLPDSWICPCSPNIPGPRAMGWLWLPLDKG